MAERAFLDSEAPQNGPHHVLEDGSLEALISSPSSSSLSDAKASSNRSRRRRTKQTARKIRVDVDMTNSPPHQIINLSTSSDADNYRVPAMPTSSTVLASVLEDWSGRGSHVDFKPDEIVPLREGRFLGHGVMGGVYETQVRGFPLAWKRRFCRQKIGDVERKEIEILKKLSHEHIIQVVGTYTHRQILGLLLHPVAACDLGTFFEDLEILFASDALDSWRLDRLEKIGFSDAISKIPPTGIDDLNALEALNRDTQVYLYERIGCIVSAVEYLHSSKIRHKDLKPSNILLSQDGLWLTDFGSATDFSTLSVSATEGGERGTPKYFAPEVAEFRPSGRAADMFSLGCILLELLTVIMHQTLDHLKSLRPDHDKSFHANLAHEDEWFSHLRAKVGYPPPISMIIRQMLQTNPEERPTAAQARMGLAHLDAFSHSDSISVFGDCCRISFLTLKEHEEDIESVKLESRRKIKRLKAEHADKINKLQRALQQQHIPATHQHGEVDQNLEDSKSVYGEETAKGTG